MIQRSGWLSPVTATVCGYECIALVTGKVPTITGMTRKCHWLAPLIVGLLSAHFYSADERQGKG